jgi:lysophospholipase L1-like esterase
MNPRILLALSALALGAMTAICGSRGMARNGAPDGLQRHSRGQPFVSQTVLADAPAPWGTWSLAAYQSLVASNPAERIDATGVLPEGGRLALTLHHRPDDSTSALIIETGESPAGRRMQLDGAGQALPCTGTVGTTQAGPFSVSVVRSGQGWTATIDGQTLSCTSPDSVGHPAITAGLRRVSLQRASVGGATASSPTPRALGLGASTVVGAALLFWGLLRVSPLTSMTAALAGGAGWLAMPIDGGQLAEAIRLVEAQDDWLPFTISVILMGLVIAVGLTARWANSTKPKLVAPGLLFAAFLGWVWSVHGAAGWGYSVAFGLSLSALVWVQVHAATLRYFNVISLALAIAALGSTEVMVRFSPVGNLWNASNTQQGAGSTATLIEQFEALEAGVHTFYPSKGFPVRLSPKQAARRIACLGASSTGGAFQNDSLADFYPALLGKLSPSSTEVVNQGVGGWNSFHLLRFLEGHADALDADVWTVYLGVNENLPTAMPFSELHEAWKAGNLTEGTQALDSIRLFQGLRLLVRGLRPGGGAGVSAADLRANLEGIIAEAESRGINVLLMSEGVRPDPRILWHYYEVMEALAAEHTNTEYLDTASMLDRHTDRAFIDTNHLTPNGHTKLARAVDAELNRLGWY